MAEMMPKYVQQVEVSKTILNCELCTAYYESLAAVRVLMGYLRSLIRKNP